MTGNNFENCPNQKACEHNAKHTHNTSCYLPYYYYPPSHIVAREVSTLIVETYLESSAKEHGYATSIELFYYHENDALIIGKKFYGDSLAIPKAALDLGFGEAEEIPYQYKHKKDKTGEYGLLTVKTKDWAFFQSFGWFEAVELPYNMRLDPDIGYFLHVEFPTGDFRYEEAIKLGWHRSSYWDYHKAVNKQLLNINLIEDDDIPF